LRFLRDFVAVATQRESINTTQRKLAGLAARAEDMANQGRLDDVQSEPSQLGHTLLRVGHYNIDAIQPGLGQKLRQIGRDLRCAITRNRRRLFSR